MCGSHWAAGGGRSLRRARWKELARRQRCGRTGHGGSLAASDRVESGVDLRTVPDLLGRADELTTVIDLHVMKGPGMGSPRPHELRSGGVRRGSFVPLSNEKIRFLLPIARKSCQIQRTRRAHAGFRSSGLRIKVDMDRFRITVIRTGGVLYCSPEK